MTFPQLDDIFISMIVCPFSKASVVQHENLVVSTCERTRLAYTIKAGIVDFLVVNATELPVDEWKDIMNRCNK